MVVSFRCLSLTLKTMNSKPTWEEAVMVYIDVLQNPDASFLSRSIAKDELMHLARAADKVIAQNKAKEH